MIDKPKIQKNIDTLNNSINTINEQLAEKAKQTDLTSLQTTVASNYSALDTKINSQASGSPKNTYATVSALTTAFPSGNTNIYVVTADGGWYYWNGSAWTKGGTYQSTGIADLGILKDKHAMKSIGINQTDFTQMSGKNKFNKDTAIPGYQLASWASYGLYANAAYSISDYIKVDPSTQYKRVRTYATAFYDANLNFISGVNGVSAFTTPANCAYIRIEIANSVIDTEQIELGTTSTTYEPYKIAIPRLVLSVMNDYDKYPFQPLVTFGNYTTESNVRNAVKKVEIYGADTSKKYCLGGIQKNFSTYGTGAYIYECNADGTTSKIVAMTSIVGYAIPVGTDVFTLNQYNSSGITAKIWVDWSYIPDTIQYVNLNYNLSGLDIRTLISSPTYIPEVITISLPSKINATIGDTLELFYKGMIQVNNPSNYNINLSATKGKKFKNRWIYTPVNGDTDFNLTVNVYDNLNNLLATKTTLIKVSPVKSSPGTLKNILCVGDSLTQNGEWVGEFKRRLTGTGGNPVGHGLSNINFIGTIGTGSKYEGYGGWRWTHYTTNTLSGNYWVTVVSHDKDASDEQSLWKDSNNNQWQLETIKPTELKFKPVTTGYTMPTNGTLTSINATHTSSISYTGATAEVGNPFWNNSLGRVDFLNYCSVNSFTGIDYCYVLLGWNNYYSNVTDIVANAKVFVDRLHLDYPNCKVVVMGLQVPNLDGYGANYGTESALNYYENLQFVFKLNKAYEDWTKESAYSSFMEFIHVSSQFDTDNNTQTATRNVNVRSSKTEVYGTNAVHPALDGYMQIADATYRKFMAI